jgi:hypothetical protein
MNTEKDIDDELHILHGKVRQLLQQNASNQQVVDALQKDGVDESYTRLLIHNVMQDRRDRKDFWKLLFMGLFTIAAGIGINYLSYQAAMHTGVLFFYVFWGIIVAGAIMIARAFILFRKS